MASASASAGRPEAGEPDLKHGAIGFFDALIVGISSTAPAYSIAAVIGIVVVGVGLQSPGVLLLSFVPMFLIASAFFYMNRADPDCGTNFSWITRAIGPSVGWVAGFAVCTTGPDRHRLADRRVGLLHPRHPRLRLAAARRSRPTTR